MSNGRLTLNGLKARIDGIEKVLEIYIKDLHEEMCEIKKSFKELQYNELKHIRQDIETIKRGYWKFMGGMAVLVVAIEILVRVVKW
jgi:hypothetical protein